MTNSGETKIRSYAENPKIGAVTVVENFIPSDREPGGEGDAFNRFANSVTLVSVLARDILSFGGVFRALVLDRLRKSVSEAFE